MKKQFSWQFCLPLVLFISLVFLGCSDEDEGEGEDVNLPEPGSEVVLEGKITEDTKLSKDYKYLLRGPVFVEGGATLNIEAGTTIYGEGATIGTLIIARGSKINANGTASDPIVMTCDLPAGSRGRGKWGGLIINGNAPINVGVEAFGEGDTGAYGGSNPNDSSGILRYVRIEWAGIEFTPDNELNGIAFQGVGSGTIVDHVQVHFNQDDGIEMFGGTCNIKHILCTGIRDDSFDWTHGWVGKGQFLIVQQRGDDADNGFENDNLGKNNEATPRSAPQIYNVTLIGDPKGPESDVGMLIREGAAGTYRNIIVMGFLNKPGLDIDNTSTYAQAKSGALTVQNCIFFDNAKGMAKASKDGFDELTWAKTSSFNNKEVDPMLTAPYSLTSPDFQPKAGSPATDGSVPVAKPPSDGFFESVSYIGGMGPGDNWTQGWTTSAQN